jgi:hypothetical protein
MAAGFASVNSFVGNVPGTAMNNERWFHEQRIAEKMEIGKWKIEARNTKLEKWCGKITNAPTGEPEKRKASNKEIENEKKEAEEEKDGRTVDAAARKVGY